MFRTRPELQIEIEKICALLSSASIGTVITYASIEDALGGNFKPWTLIKARQLVEQESGLRIATVHGVGVKKLSAADVVGIGKDARKKIGKIAKHQAARLTGLQYNDISPEAQKRIDAERSLLGAISMASAMPAARAIEKHISTGPETARTVLELLSKQA